MALRNPAEAGPSNASRYPNSRTATSIRSKQTAGTGASTVSTTQSKPLNLPSTSNATSSQTICDASSSKPLNAPKSGQGHKATDVTVSTRRAAVKSTIGAAKATSSSSSFNARHPSKAPVREHIPTRTSDSLQVAAQLFPWMYMTSTLEECFQSAETAARRDLEIRAKELSEEEKDLSDRRIRFETERILAFYDELSSNKFVEAAPSIMQSFLGHGDSCTSLTAEALRLATHNPNQENNGLTIQGHNDILAKLEDLQTQATLLESSILHLTESEGVDAQPRSDSCSQILSVYSACLPVIRSRIVNLRTAHELLRVSKENLSMILQMKSLQLSA